MAPIAATFLLMGCGDGLSPQLRGAKLRIYMGGSPFDEQTVVTGEVLQLEARVLDAKGDWIQGAAVSWSVDRTDVATVNGNGGVVTLGIGTARVVAHHAVGEDTAYINVAAPVTGPIECSPGATLSIAPGQVRSFAGPEAVLLCLPGNAGSIAEYAVVVSNLGTTATSVLPVRIQAAGTIDGPPAPNVLSDPARTEDGSPHLLENGEFHRRIRERSSRSLEYLLPGGTAAIAADGGQIAQQSIGELITFNGSIEGSPCEVGSPRTGRVRRVSQRAIIVEDTVNPPGGFTEEDYGAFAEFFDADVWPLVTGTFGLPSDIDGNGRVIILFTVTVNELPENSNSSNSGVVGGFFFNRDLFPTSSCAGSNRAEMFYLMVPDPAGQPQPGGRRAFSADLVRRRTPSLLVHEFQHLVNDSRRLHVSKSPVWEETWLNEGLSHMAEELMFFQQAGVTTGANLSAADLTSTASREAFRAFHIDNLDRFTIFLDAPEDASVYGSDELATRGATWSFLRYAADRSGGDGKGLLGKLVKDSRLSGLANLQAALGTDPLEWMRDWTVAIWADDTGLDSDPKWRIQSWNYRELYAGLGTVMPSRPSHPYPLHALPLTSGNPRNLALQGGGAGYVTVALPSGGQAALRTTIGGQQQLPPPSRVKVTVLRVR